MVDEKNNIFIVIPVYNNNKTILNVVLKALNIWNNVIVVDDGSDDCDVSLTLKNTSAVILKHTSNQGKGKALQTALKYLKKKNAKYMITIDADSQHNPEDVLSFIPILKKEENLLIIGTRNFSSANIPKSSIFGRSFSNFWVRIETGLHLSDTQSGFRAYPVDKLYNLNITSKSYTFEIESIVKLIWSGVKVISIPVSVFYPPQNERITHFKKIRDNLKLSLIHIKLILIRLFPNPKKFIQLKKIELNDISITMNPFKILKMIIYDHSSPSALATSAAVGIFIGVLPIFGFHIVTILYISLRLHLNKAMSLSIQNICTPPFVPALCIYIGYYLRTGSFLHNISYKTIFNSMRLLEWLIGSLILAPFLALITFIGVYIIAKAFHNKLYFKAQNYD